MPKMSYWDQFVGSFIKTGYYEELINQTQGKVISYLLLLTFITSLLFGIKLAFLWNGIVDSMASNFAQMAPEFVFADGGLTVNAPMPYIIEKTKDQILVVDTTGKTDETILKDYRNGLFIGKNKIINKKNELETSYYDLSSVKGVTVTKSTALKYIPWLKWFNVFIIMFMFIYEIIANLIAAFFLSLGGWLTGRIMNCRLIFSDLYKIGIYALTLPLLLELTRDILALKIPYFKFGFYVVAMIYVIVALRTIKKGGNREPGVPVQ